MVISTVTGIFAHESTDVWALSFENGDTLGVTGSHPIYSLDANDWVLASTLSPSNQVLTKSGHVTVTSVKKIAWRQKVYNLEVKDWHNFLVGDLGVVVHNSYGWILNILHFPFQQVKRKMKHAHYFGFSTNLNTTNVKAYIKYLEDFVSNKTGKKYLPNVNYKGQHTDAIVVLEESTRLMVVTKGSGEFITAYKMSVEQVAQLLNDKFIW